MAVTMYRCLIVTAAGALLLPTITVFGLRSGRQRVSVELEDAAAFQAAVRRPAARRTAAAATTTLALGTRCRGGSDDSTAALPAQLVENSTQRGARAAEILRDLWTCRTPAGVRTVGGKVSTEVPAALQEAVAISPAAAKQVFTAASADSLEQDTLNWGSGGNTHALPESSVAYLMAKVFHHVDQAGLSIYLEKQDLFHGHVFCLPPSANGSGELGILFHAKEYPEDLGEPKGIGSGYTTRSAGYGDRNLLYLASTNQVYVIDPVEESRSNWPMLANLEIQEWLPDSMKPWVVKTIDERSFLDVGSGSRFVDINYLPKYLSKPTGPTVVFTKAF